MIVLHYSSKYLAERKKFLRNNRILVEKVIKVLLLFVENPKHPSLKLEKLQGVRVWMIRIDRGNRIFFSWIDDNTVLLIDIGKHDKYRRY